MLKWFEIFMVISSLLLLYPAFQTGLQFPWSSYNCPVDGHNNVAIVYCGIMGSVTNMPYFIFISIFLRRSIMIFAVFNHKNLYFDFSTFFFPISFVLHEKEPKCSKTIMVSIWKKHKDNLCRMKKTILVQ